MIYEYSMNDDFFKDKLFPVFKSNVSNVCAYVGTLDLSYKDDTTYSSICGDIYNMIKACAVSKSSSRSTLEAIMLEIGDTPNDDIVGGIDKFVQALLCYYILSNDKEYTIKLGSAREEFLASADKGKDMGARVEEKHAVEEEVGELSVTSWDEYYFNIAKATAANSKCFSRKIGCVIVRDKSIIGSGYNSPPRGVPACDKRWNKDGMLFKQMIPVGIEFEDRCPRQVLDFKSGQGMEYCTASHAEESTITNCARMGVVTKGATMYMTCGIPCYNCMITIINAGVAELVVTSLSYYDKLSQYLLENSDIKVRKFDFLN